MLGHDNALRHTNARIMHFYTYNRTPCAHIPLPHALPPPPTHKRPWKGGGVRHVWPAVAKLGIIHGRKFAVSHGVPNCMLITYNRATVQYTLPLPPLGGETGPSFGGGSHYHSQPATAVARTLHHWPHSHACNDKGMPRCMCLGACPPWLANR